MRPCKLLRIALLGDSGVGKSTLLRRFEGTEFADIYKISTVGVDFATKYLHDKDHGDIELQLWDTAGQERFRAISESYLKSVHAVLLVCAADNQKSLNEIVSTWHPMVMRNERPIYVALVVNKMDVAPTGFRTALIQCNAPPPAANEARLAAPERPGADPLPQPAKTMPPDAPSTLPPGAPQTRGPREQDEKLIDGGKELRAFVKQNEMALYACSMRDDPKDAVDYILSSVVNAVLKTDIVASPQKEAVVLQRRAAAEPNGSCKC